MPQNGRQQSSDSAERNAFSTGSCSKNTFQGTGPRPSRTTMSEDQFFLNGIDGVTGEYLVPPLSAESVARLIRPVEDREHSGWLKRLRNLFTRPFLGLPVDIDPTDVARAGWSVVVSPQTPFEVLSALEPLIAHRRSQVLADRCKTLEYRAGENMKDWLKRHGVYPGSAAHNAVGLAGESPVVGIDCLP